MEALASATTRRHLNFHVCGPIEDVGTLVQGDGASISECLRLTRLLAARVTLVVRRTPSRLELRKGVDPLHL